MIGQEVYIEDRSNCLVQLMDRGLDSNNGNPWWKCVVVWSPVALIRTGLFLYRYESQLREVH